MSIDKTNPQYYHSVLSANYQTWACGYLDYDKSSYFKWYNKSVCVHWTLITHIYLPISI